MEEHAPAQTKYGTHVNEPAVRATWADAALLAAILVLMLWGLGSYGLYEPHEGHFAGVGREMVLTGDWITPHLNGAPYLNKPPLFYWLIALSYSAFGISEWAARLPLALIGFAGVVLAWQWARELWGAGAGRTAAAMLATAAGWYLFSHQLLIDTLLAVLHLAAAYFLWKAVSILPAPPHRDGAGGWCARYWVCFYTVLGLQVLAKGLVGLAFSGAMVLAFCAWRRDWRLLWRCRPLLGLGILAVLVTPWVWAIEHRNPGFLRYVIYNEHFKRVAGTRWPPDYDVSQVSAPMFLLMALVWLAPWSLLLPRVAVFAWRRANAPLSQSNSLLAAEPQQKESSCVDAGTGRRGDGGGRGDRKSSRREKICGVSNTEQRAARERDACAILLLAALIPTLLFLPVPARLIYYCLPTVPPFMVLAAGWLAGAEIPEIVWGRTKVALMLAVTGIVAIPVAVIPTGAYPQIAEFAAAPAVVRRIPLLFCLVGVALLCTGLLAVKCVRPALIWACVLLAAAQISATGGFVAFDTVRSSKRLVAWLDERLGPDCIWVSEGSKEIGAAGGTEFYLGPGPDGKVRAVLVMEDDPRRPPPAFPGRKPDYLIAQEQLAKLWAGPQPVIFVTDFLRTDWKSDPPHLPPNPLPVPVSGAGMRQVYANAAAEQRLRR